MIAQGSHVMVIGGGAAGTLAAAHLLRYDEARLRVTVVEPGLRLGRGLAYGTDSPSHLLNARARNMSAYDDQPEAFADWLAVHDTPGPAGERYAQRRHFGRYLEDVLSQWREDTGDGRLHHLRGEAVDVVETADGVQVTLADGTAGLCRAAVLAIGHGLAGGAPPSTEVEPDAKVFILGTGLGMVDRVLTLLDAGHRGQVLALSRRGLLPQPHGPRTDTRLDRADVPFGTHLSYFQRWLRTAAEDHIRRGGQWSDIVDALRPHVPEVWAHLPPATRARFLRHARPWWDTHRHRMAPEIAQRINAARVSGQLSVRAGRVIERTEKDHGVTVVWRQRGRSACQSEHFGLALDCTGPRCSPLASDRLLSRLFATGVARSDPLRLGIALAPNLAVLAASGSRSRRIYAVGPLTCPLGWETYAIPEIRAQCTALAKDLLGLTAHDRQSRTDTEATGSYR